MENKQNVGRVLSVRGSVVDAVFHKNLPTIRNVLRAGDNGQVLIEVNTQLDADTVRGVALTPTQGVARGSAIYDTGEPFKVPVGKRLLGRVFNVFGNAIDEEEPVKGGEWRSIHSPPVPLTQQSTVS